MAELALKQATIEYQEFGPQDSVHPPVFFVHGILVDGQLWTDVAEDLGRRGYRCVVPTLIQEAGPNARPVEDKRAELAGLPTERRLTDEELAAIRTAGDNQGCMALKGATPDHTGEERPDRWALNEHLSEVAGRWQIEPDRDLVQLAAHHS